MQTQKYSFIRHLCWGILLNHDPTRTWILAMAEWAAYLDDSGHPDDQPFVVCAGFLSTEEGWLSFESAWNAMLRKHGLGGVLHMADFHGKRTKKQEGMVLEDLTKIIVTHLRVGLSTFVDMQAYRKVNDLYALEEGVGTP